MSPHVLLYEITVFLIAFVRTNITEGDGINLCKINARILTIYFNEIIAYLQNILEKKPRIYSYSNTSFYQYYLTLIFVLDQNEKKTRNKNGFYSDFVLDTAFCLCC